jgi:hypothetical protein
MTLAMTLPEPAPTSPTLRVIRGSRRREPIPWWQRRSLMRDIVGGCPDHWWKSTATRTAACTCDRF